MKRANSKSGDEPRPEYKRSDFGALVRGKYAERVKQATNVIVLEPRVARAFPNDKAVNPALRHVMRSRKSSTRKPVAAGRTRRQRTG